MCEDTGRRGESDLWRVTEGRGHDALGQNGYSVPGTLVSADGESLSPFARTGRQLCVAETGEGASLPDLAARGIRRRIAAVHLGGVHAGRCECSRCGPQGRRGRSGQ